MTTLPVTPCLVILVTKFITFSKKGSVNKIYEGSSESSRPQIYGAVWGSYPSSRGCEANILTIRPLLPVQFHRFAKEGIAKLEHWWSKSTEVQEDYVEKLYKNDLSLMMLMNYPSIHSSNETILKSLHSFRY